MEDTELSTLFPSVFTEKQGKLDFNCGCFNGSIHSIPAVYGRNFDYVKEEKERSINLLSEIEKHEFFDFQGVEELKPCYGAFETTSFQLRNAYQRHEKTLMRLTKEIKKLKDKTVYIKFDNGKEASVDVYNQTMKANIRAQISTVVNFASYYSTVPIETIKKSERSHLNSLTVLENVRQVTSNGSDKLGVYLESSF